LSDLVEPPQIVLPYRDNDRLRSGVADQIRHLGVRPTARGARSREESRLDRHVERVTYLERELRARARVADQVLADELRLTSRIASVHPNDAARQRLAEAASPGVREAYAHIGGHRREGTEKEEGLLVAFVGRDALGVQEADLLRLVV